MNKSHIIFLFTGLFLFVMTSCNNKIDEKNIIGRWECPMTNESFKGRETIEFHSDSKVDIYDQIIYTIADEELELKLNCKVSNSGKWSYKNGMLKLTLQDLRIDIDTATMDITLLNNNSRLDTLKHAYNVIKKEIYNYTKTEIQKVFHERSNKNIDLGHINFHNLDSMIIDNSGQAIILSRL